MRTFPVELRCTKRSEEETTWTECVCLPVQVPVEYKYVLKHNGIVTQWETITGNRTVTPGVANVALYVSEFGNATHNSNKALEGNHVNRALVMRRSILQVGLFNLTFLRCIIHITKINAVPGFRVANTANNGNTNGYHEWMCCHTNKEFQPWWQVDLEAVCSQA